MQIVKENNYIDSPKKDGYRSYHIVFEYQRGKEDLKGYKIELQIRDLNQHRWATAVEIFSLISKNNLKIGKGEEYYKRFFYLYSKLMQDKIKDKEKEELKKLDKEYKILSILSGANFVLKAINTKDKDLYYLIALNLENKEVNSYVFSKKQLDIASLLYETLEEQEHINAVLVDIDSIKNLKKAYPNYFGNAKEFIGHIKGALY